MEVVFLSKIAEIKSGYQFREQIKPVENGSIGIIQMKDVNPNNLLNLKNLVKVDIKNIDKRYFLKKGDILFKSKGYNNTSSVITEEIDNTVSHSHFFIIRVNQKNVLPEFVCWFLNQKSVQTYFKTNCAGTSLPMIHKKVLEEVVINMPDLELQQKIARTHYLSIREAELLEQIKGKKKLLVETILSKKIETI